MITRRGDRELVADVQTMLTELGFDAGVPDGFAGEMTRSAIAGFKRWKNLPSKGTLISKEMLAALYAAAGREPAPQGQLYIRQGFKEVLSTPVAIRDPERELGTYLYTVADIDPKNGQAVWQAIGLRNELSDGTRKRLGIAPKPPCLKQRARAFWIASRYQHGSAPRSMICSPRAHQSPLQTTVLAPRPRPREPTSLH